MRVCERARVCVCVCVCVGVCVYFSEYVCVSVRMFVLSCTNVCW